MAKRRTLELTGSDHFCGCGGSGSGAKKALDRSGGRMVYGANHWKTATESYEENKIADKVYCADLSGSHPSHFPYTTFSLWSPECTAHSPAGGNTHKKHKQQMDLFDSGKVDPATIRSRATMWDVVHFFEYHRYEFGIVENVVEAKTQWVLFDDWLRAMHTLGYNHKVCYFNSMFFYPTPQSRDRMYVVFWKKGNKAPNLEFTPLAHCQNCSHDVYAVQCWKKPDKKFGKYGSRGQYIYCCPQCTHIVEPYYYAAFNCIDWTDIGTRIGDRPNPLADKTEARIQKGLDLYGTQPLIINDQNSTGIDFRVRGTNKHLPTITTTPHLKLFTPFLIKTDNTSVMNKSVLRSSKGPMSTQTTKLNSMVITPWIIEMNKTGEAKPANAHMSTLTAGGFNHAVLHAPFMVENKGQSKSRSIVEPISTLTTKSHHGIITTEAWNSFITCFNGKGINKPIHKSLPTQSTKERLMLVNYKKPKLEDCYYRMIKTHEVKKGMAFDDDHIVLGKTEDQVRQMGGAVTPPVMEWLTERCIESLN